MKAHIARISENALKYEGVIVYNMDNVPLGFGVLAKSADEMKNSDPTAIYVYNQADIGEYLRVESQKTN